MDTDLAHLLSNEGRLNQVSTDALLVYLLMRADISINETTTAKVSKAELKLVSGLSVQTIARRLRLSHVTVVRVIDELLRCEWIKSISADADTKYQLGTIENYSGKWFVNSLPELKPHSMGVSGDIRRLLAERKDRIEGKKSVSRLSPEARKRLAIEAGILGPERGGSTRLVKHVKNRFWEKYRERLPGFEDAGRPAVKMNAFASRIIDWCGADFTAALAYCDWVFDNWAVISVLIKLESARPTLNLLATRSFFDKFTEWMLKGLPVPKAGSTTGIERRADSKAIAESKDVGW